MSTYTKGPWEKKQGTLIGSDGSEVVAAGLGIGLGQDSGDGNRLANTNLIAAAPELLEALEILYNEWDQTYDGEPMSIELHTGYEKARAAIAKAKGES